MLNMNQVRDAVMECLKSAGLEAVQRMGLQAETYPSGAVAAVGVHQSSGQDMAFCSYLGQRYDPEKDTICELYGKRLEIELNVDIYALSPEKCEEAVEIAAEVLLAKLPGGIKPIEGQWEELKWDRERTLYFRQGTVRCTAYFTAACDEENPSLLDFELKGVVHP